MKIVMEGQEQQKVLEAIQAINEMLLKTNAAKLEKIKKLTSEVKHLKNVVGAKEAMLKDYAIQAEDVIKGYKEENAKLTANLDKTFSDANKWYRRYQDLKKDFDTAVSLLKRGNPRKPSTELLWSDYWV